MSYPWLTQALTAFTSTVQQGRMPQAVLLVGPAGIGLTEMAKSMANVALCEALTVSGACGVCRSCELLAANHHPDLINVNLVEKSRFIKVDQVRALSQQLNQTAQYHRQVAVIDPAQQLNTAAANALLKTLEEPAGSVLLILTAHHRSQVPATISSRTQVVDLTLHEPAAALQWLAARYPEEDPDVLLRMSSGGPLLVESLLAQNYRELRAELLQLLSDSAVAGSNVLPGIPALIKHDAALLLRALSGLVSDLVKLLAGVGSVYLTNPDLQPAYARLLPQLDIMSMQVFYDHVNQAVRQHQSGIHINVQMQWERLLVLWRNVGRLRKVLC